MEEFEEIIVKEDILETKEGKIPALREEDEGILQDLSDYPRDEEEREETISIEEYIFEY